MSKRVLWFGFLLTLLAVQAWAGNGHLLHGVGAVNSSMGGSGTGLPTDIISSLHLNPALLTQFEDHNVAISTEFFVDDLSVTTEAPGFPEHTTDSDGDPGVLPAVAWAYRNPNKPYAIGWGLLAIAGFRTNWPVDPESALLAPQPFGFGKLNTELQVTKVPFALAYQVNDNLSLGGSLNVYQSRLIINPLPVVVPDCQPPVGGVITDPNVVLLNEDCFRPNTGVMVTEFGWTVQAGLYYEIGPKWSLGLSYTSELDTDPYEWNSEHVNPHITTGPNAFGLPRKISIDLDQPPVASVGLGYRPSSDLEVALDVKWVGYADTQGIGGTGGVSNLQELISIGWDDILAYMLGVKYQASPAMQWRFGLNFNDSPIQDHLTLNSGGTPSVFEEHYTIGLTYALTPNFNLDLGAYYTPENEKTGPFIAVVNGVPNQPVPDSAITLRNSILSALIGFSFHF